MVASFILKFRSYFLFLRVFCRIAVRAGVVGSTPFFVFSSSARHFFLSLRIGTDGADNVFDRFTDTFTA